MPFKLSLYGLIPLLTLIQGLLFTTLFIIRGYREERYADFWLALSLFFIGVNGIPYMLGWMGIELLWETYTYLPWDGFWLAIPPAIYLFLKSLTNDQWRFDWRKDAWHFWAYALYFIEHLVVGGIGWSNKTFLDQWTQQPILKYGYEALNWGIEIYYFILSYRLYQQYKQWTLNEFSDPERVSFNWLRNYLIIKFCLTLIGMANAAYVQLSPKQGNDFYALMWLGYFMDTILIYYLSISGYVQTRIKVLRYEGNSPSPILLSPNAPTEPSDAIVVKPKNTLSDEDLSAWKQQVLTLFQQQKPYLQPDLTLSDVAEKMQTNTSILSQVINTGFGKNFNDFVNEYRVTEFTQKAKSPEYAHLTLLALAFDCGFNSKATFNRAFKKITGQNPRDI